MIFKFKSEEGILEISTKNNVYTCTKDKNNNHIYRVYDSNNKYVGSARFLANVQSLISNFEE